MKNIITAFVKGFQNTGSTALKENGFITATAFADKSKPDPDGYWVGLCLEIISKTVSSTDMYFEKWTREGAQELEDNHPVMKVMKKPDGVLSFRKWVKKLTGIYKAKGEAFVWSTDKFDNRIKFIILTKDNFVTDVQTGTKKVHYEGKTYNYDEKEIKRFLNPDFTAAQRAFSTNDKIKEWITADGSLNLLFTQVSENGSVVGGTLETELTQPKELDKLRIRWEELYKGFKKNTRDIILPRGMKYNATNIAPKDINLDTLKNTSKLQILNAYQVPKELLGIVDGAGRANVDGAFYGFSKFVIVPLLEDLKEFINDEILSQFVVGGLNADIYFDFDSPVPEDKLTAAQIRQLESGNKQYKTVNEIRLEMGLPELEGQDGLNQNPIADLIAAQSAKKKEIKFKRVPQRVKDFSRSEQKSSSILAKAAEQLAAVIKDNSLEAEAEKKSVRTFTVAEAAAVMMIIEKSAQRDAYIEEAKKNDKAFDLKDYKSFVKTKAMSDDMKKLLMAMVSLEGNETIALIGSGAFVLDDADLQEELERIYTMRDESWDQTTKDQLLKTAKQGIEDGLSATELDDALNAVFTLRAGQGAYLLAHDIVYTMSNAASNSAMIQSKVVTKKVWVAVGDEKTCGQCGTMNQPPRNIIDVKEVFLKDGEEYTGTDGKTYSASFGKVGYPPLHPSCRCAVLPETIVVK